MKCTSFPAHKVHIYFQSNYYTDFYTYDVIVLGMHRGETLRKLLTVIGITFLMLAGCSNGDFEKEIDAGKTALTNKEYKNALSSFERALDEKKDDSDAIVLVEQTKIMMEAVKLKEEKR